MRTWKLLVIVIILLWTVPWALPGGWPVACFVFSIWMTLVWVKGYHKLSILGLVLALSLFAILLPDATLAFWAGFAPLALLACLPSRAARSGWVMSAGGNGSFAFYIAGTRGKSLR